MTIKHKNDNQTQNDKKYLQDKKYRTQEPPTKISVYLMYTESDEIRLAKH